MNRFKFRAFDIQNKKMVYFDNLTTATDCSGSVKLHAYGEGFTSGNFSELMQFTGHTDVDGTPIYEEDIIRYKNTVGVVKFRPDILGFHINYQDGSSMFLTVYESVKILSNTFQNPELLKDLNA